MLSFTNLLIIGFGAATLWAIRQARRKIMAILDDLEAKVAAETTVEASAIKLLTELSAELKAAVASNDPTRIQAVITTLDANNAALAAAITANTPAAPPTAKA